MGGALKPFVLVASLIAGFSAGGDFRVRGFAFAGVSNRFITPNGDGRNDDVAFQFSNPRDSSGTIKIYDVRGHVLATLAVNPGDASEVWDGRAGGRLVDAGLYVYVVHVEDVVVSGAVVVIR